MMDKSPNGMGRGSLSKCYGAMINCAGFQTQSGRQTDRTSAVETSMASIHIYDRSAELTWEQFSNVVNFCPSK